MTTGAIEVKVDSIEVLNDIPETLPILPNIKNLKVSYIIPNCVVGVWQLNNYVRTISFIATVLLSKKCIAAVCIIE